MRAVLVLACLCAGPAFAQTLPRPAPQAPPEPTPTPEVSGVTVMPTTERPKVVSTFPAAGQAVAPGVLVLKVTFDQKMLKTGFDFEPAVAAGEAPSCLKTPRLLNDEKTFVLLCTVGAGKTYALALNEKPTGGFVNLAENRAEPASLSFTTTTADPVRSLGDALKVADLKEIDGPIQEAPGF